MLPIRLVCATKLSEHEFFNQSFTGQSVRIWSRVAPVEIKLTPNNKEGLSFVYNEAIVDAINNPAILVFIHDDIIVSDYFWVQRVREGLERFDIAGIAGNINRAPNQSGWCVVDTKGTMDNLENLRGSVGQGNMFPPQHLAVFGETNNECKLMDGLFLAAKSQTLIDNNVRFDEQFKFHHYDLDFCRTAEKANLKMGVIPLSLVHYSYGNMDNVWLESFKKYIEKWGD